MWRGFAHTRQMCREWRIGTTRHGASNPPGTVPAGDPAKPPGTVPSGSARPKETVPAMQSPATTLSNVMRREVVVRLYGRSVSLRQPQWFPLRHFATRLFRMTTCVQFNTPKSASPFAETLSSASTPSVDAKKAAPFSQFTNRLPFTRMSRCTPAG